MNSKVIKKPDGSVGISFDLPFDEFGPPFGYKELVTVPRYDEKYFKESDQPTPVGSPGEYEVKFIFARPELSLTNIKEVDLDIVNGDSSCIITTPIPRKKSDPTGISIDIDYTVSKTQTKSCSFMLRPNKHGRLSEATTTIFGNGYREARYNAYHALLPFLSKLSFEHNIPLEIKSTTTIEKSTQGQNHEFRIQFPPKRFSLLGQGLYSQEILALLSFYREGMNSTSISYSFLCFYRILEAIYNKRDKIGFQKDVRFEFERENRITNEDLLGLVKHMGNYKEFIGKKFGNIYEKYLTPQRIKIAHGLLGEDNPIEDTPDDINLRHRSSYLTPIAQIIARLEIQNELTKRTIPRKH